MYHLFLITGVHLLSVINPFLNNEDNEAAVALQSLVVNYKLMSLDAMNEILVIKLSRQPRACSGRERFQKVYDTSSKIRIDFLTQVLLLRSPVLVYRSLDNTPCEFPKSGAICMTFQDPKLRSFFGFTRVTIATAM